MNVDLTQLAIERDEAGASQAGSRRHWLTRYVLPGALLLGFLAVVAWMARGLIFPAKDVKVIPVLVTKAESQRAGTPLFKAAGWIQPRPTATRVAALAPGVVRELLVVEDQAVKQGEPIAKLVAEDAELSLSRAVADRELRQAEVDHAKATLAAAHVRFEQPVHLKAPLDEAESKLTKLERELTVLPYEIQRADARLELAELELAGKVKAGRGVAELEVAQARSELATATAIAEECRARVALVEKERDAIAGLCDSLRTRLQLKADETQVRDESAAQVKAAEARLAQARVAEAEARLRLDRMTVPAPIDGRVLNLLAEPGTRLTAEMGGTASRDASTVVTMYRPDMLQIRVDVRFEDLPQVQLGQPVLIESPAVAKPLDGQVLFISSLADIQKNTLEVKVAIDKPPHVFKPEMLVDVTFLAPDTARNETAGTEQLRLYVPSGLVERGQGGAFVWLADQDAGVARRVAVAIGPVGSNGLVEVKKGLNPASRLITSGLDGIDDGDRIQVVEEDTAGHSSVSGERTGPE